jgi:hypothetical protein
MKDVKFLPSFFFMNFMVFMVLCLIGATRITCVHRLALREKVGSGDFN